MKLTKKHLQSVHIINDYDYAKRKEPFIYYRNQQLGRAYQCAAWCIHQPGYEFPDTHWRDYGNLAFNIFSRSDKQKQLDLAIAKFKELYKCDDVSKTPFGSYMDKKFVDLRNEEIKQLLAEKQD